MPLAGRRDDEEPARSGALDGTDQAPPDITHASSTDQIEAALALLAQREGAVTAELDRLVGAQKDLARDVGRLDLVRAHLGSQVVSSRSISHGMLSDAAVTADRISSAVKRLDLEQSRVKATLDVVEQVAELKVCVLGVTAAMGRAQDWEKAAGFLNRASKVPADVIDGSFAEEMVPTAEVPDLPRVTLHDAAESLCGLFLREFEKAAQENDGSKVTRFFKLFPLIGRSDVGLDIYGRYVCQGVTSRARSNLNAGTGATQRKEGFFYANALTKLFEHIAQIVDGHGGLVERHYGAGRMVRVMERLQREADVQGGIVLETWSDERSIDRKLTDIKSYAFSFLVQSFLSSRTGAGTARANSPAKRAVAGERRNSEEEADGVEMKEVDGLLSEAAVMLGRWSLYCRFMANKCRTPTPTDGDRADDEGPLKLPELLLESNLMRKVSDRLIGPFNAMSTFFFRRSVERAFQLDEAPTDLSLNMQQPLQSNPPYITSAVDDVMYIVNKVLQRTLATSQRAVVSGVVPTIARVLGSDFVGMIQRKMRDESYPKAVIQGGLPPEDKIVAFLVLINNLDVATEYISRIVSTQVDGATSSSTDQAAHTPLRDLYPFEDEAVMVAATLRNLQQSFESKTGELIADGLHVAFDRVIKPRLRPMMAEAFRDTDYAREPTTAEYDPADPSGDGEEGGGDGLGGVRGRFERGWESLTRPLRRLLTAASWTKLLATTSAYLSGKVLEKRLWSLAGRVTALGAVHLERDVAAIVGVVARSGGRYELRNAFARCAQICLVLGLDESEWEEVVRRGEAEGGLESGGKGGGVRREGQGEDADEAAGAEEEEEEEEVLGLVGGWKLDRDERARARAMLVVSGGSVSALS